LAISNDCASQGNITLQTSDDVGSLLFLVPADQRIEQKNTDNHTKINPFTETSREQDSEFHH
jgi:hypothetical protein